MNGDSDKKFLLNLLLAKLRSFSLRGHIVGNFYHTIGGITLLLAGDFRQTLPVVPQKIRANVVKEANSVKKNLNFTEI